MTFRAPCSNEAAADSELERIARIAPLRQDAHLEVGQDEVPAIGASQAALGHALVPDRLEADPGDGVEPGRSGDGVGVVVRNGTACRSEDRAILEDREFLGAGLGGLDLQQRPGRLVPRLANRLLPPGPFGLKPAFEEVQVPPKRRELPVEFLFACLLFLAGNRQDGGGLRIAASTVYGRLVEEGEEAVILLLGQRIVLVVVTATTVEGETHPDRAGGLGHIHHVVHAVLFRDSSAFAIDRMVPQEAGGELLLGGGIGQEVAGQLPDCELIPGDVSVEGVDHPVAPWPHGAFAVALVAVRVGVTCGVEPRPRHPLPVTRRGEEAIDQIAVGFRGGLAEKLGDFFGRGREAAQVEREATNETVSRCFRGLLQALLPEPARDEGIDRIVDGGVPDLRNRGTFDRDEGPVLLVLGALLDPATENLLIVGIEREVRIRGRHHIISLVGGDALPKERSIGVVGDDGPAVLAFREGALGSIEAQLGLASLGVEAVTDKTAVRQDRADVEIEVQGSGGQGHRNE